MVMTRLSFQASSMIRPPPLLLGIPSQVLDMIEAHGPGGGGGASGRVNPIPDPAERHPSVILSEPIPLSDVREPRMVLSFS